jgi:hypothetical protein
METDNSKAKFSPMVHIAMTYQEAWLKANWGVFGEIARQLSKKKRVSRQFVREVFYGRRRSERVERAFQRIKAPGFAKLAECNRRRAAA